jgi:hypothetical protein
MPNTTTSTVDAIPSSPIRAGAPRDIVLSNL